MKDAKVLRDNQRKILCMMLYDALVEIRVLTWDLDELNLPDNVRQRFERVNVLADVFHNVPEKMWEEFSFPYFEEYYRAKCKEGDMSESRKELFRLLLKTAKESK